ncbi:MAG: PD40 domain-containing protein [Pseudomonadales bacterium]|nr:PD40 domain-containing protein [Pseudomonadales bacterium]
MRIIALTMASLGVLIAACSPQSGSAPGTASSEPAHVESDGTAGATAMASPAAPAGMDSHYESELLPNTHQLITEGRRSGEGYFSADGNRLIYQAEIEGDNPFYQIFVRDLLTGTTTRVSPGIGLTTCSWIHPTEDSLLFASTHEDPNAVNKQQQEIAMRASAEPRGYAWDYDEHYDIYQGAGDGSNLVNLTNSPGYDAEGSWSSDGKTIVFASNREAYNRPLSQAEQRLFDDDKSYFMDLYLMDADGSNVRKLTFSPGYDGGPFFSADDQQIVWRRFNPDGNSAEIWVMDADGSNQRQLTDSAMVSWGPYFHPSGKYIIYSSNVLGHANFELFMIDTLGQHEPVRVTNTEGTDILPVFSPDGNSLAWSSTRTPDGSSQIYMADWNHERALELLGLN